MPTPTRFTARLRLTTWASRCTHVYREDDPRREREARKWAADDIYRDLTAALPGPPGRFGDFYANVVSTGVRTGRVR
jgi:hypothetical protein